MNVNFGISPRLYPFIFIWLLMAFGCQSKKTLSNSTLILRIVLNGQHMTPVGHSIQSVPFYQTDTSQPIYKAVLFDKNDKKIGTVLFEESIFWGNSKVYSLAFPLYHHLHRIVVYKLDASSGHITNKNHDVVLNWIVPPDSNPPKR